MAALSLAMPPPYLDMMDDATGTMLADRALLRVAGEDARGFLQGLLTNDLTLLAADRPLWAGLLTPQGKALFEVILWADDEAILVDVEATQAELLARRLAMYRLRRPIEIAPVAGAVHWSRDGTGRGAADPRLAALGQRWLGGVGEPTIGWHRHRLALGVVEGVGEIGSGETLWLEANARELNGVSFAKGCYVGQENTARMHHRGKVNRRLVVAPLTTPGDRTRAVHADLGVMIEHRRVDALGDAIVPPWLAGALAVDQRPTAI